MVRGIHPPVLADRGLSGAVQALALDMAVPVRVEAIPVRRGDRLIAVVARNTNLQGVRTPSRLELSYLQTASELSQMIAHGLFPFPSQRSDHADTPRVGDGFIRVDAEGRVTYASPNALSVYRKLGASSRAEAVERIQDLGLT